MRLWLLRHAAAPPAPGRCRGRTDFEPDRQATAEAARAAARALPPGTALRCSPLRRCAQLAEELLLLRPDLACRSDARLAEMDFGDWENRLWDEIGPAALDAWTADFAGHRPGGGESVAQFMARVGSAWDELSGAPGETAWITHAGVICAAQLLARGVRCPRRAADWPDGAVPHGRPVLLDLGR